MTVDYQFIQEVLEAGRAVTGAAECHGLLTGMLCVPGAFTRNRLVEQALADACGEGEADARCREALDALAREARRQLESSDLDFQPLLPHDDAPLGERTAALARWCEGFLYGLGLGGLDRHGPLSAEASEALADLGEFTRLSVASGDGAGEGDYAELVEYLRVAVLTLHAEGDAAGAAVH